MSSQTGIKVSAKLSDAWKQATAPGSNVRAVKVSIINESLEDDGLFDIQGSFEKDFAIVHDNLLEKQPAYFLVRLGDSKSSSEWVFLCYVPDVAPIRQKMIYAATRASLTRDLGDSHFSDSIYGTNKGDFTLEGYKKHKASLAAPKPLSERERQLAEIRANEKTLVESMKGGAYRKSHAPGMAFPLTEKAVAALKKLVVVASAPAPKKKVVASAVPKKLAGSSSSPASTPLPASPVVSQENSTLKALAAVNVEDDEWDNDGEAPKKEEEGEEPAVVEAQEEKAEEVEAAVEEEEEEPEVVAKQERTINFVKLAIDAENETIDLVSEAKLSANQVHKNIDEESPRFTFFAYEHTHNGAAHDSLVFMYTCPGKSKIRERMLYSSCRAGVLQGAKEDAGLNVDKKLETTDVSDLTEEFILDELHPKTHQSAFGMTTGINSPRGFSKPARPGARRVM
ncbi:MAG: hypothetical protein J3R72DRAFT_445948 [Linnemannia gamsii]|nr:MAG: hypothetical protein J3R72DRAFT_445948 [Linnemannia gamsii]